MGSHIARVGRTVLAAALLSALAPQALANDPSHPLGLEATADQVYVGFTSFSAQMHFSSILTCETTDPKAADARVSLYLDNRYLGGGRGSYTAIEADTGVNTPHVLKCGAQEPDGTYDTAFLLFGWFTNN